MITWGLFCEHLSGGSNLSLALLHCGKAGRWEDGQFCPRSGSLEIGNW